MSAIAPLFVTEVYAASLNTGPGFDAFNKELIQACQMLADEDLAGRDWCRRNHYRGYTSYASLADLPQRASVFQDLKRKLDRHAAEFAKVLNFDLGGRRLKLDSLWANLLEPGGSHSGHLHPNSVVSGTVYLEVPKGSGALRFEDPRLPMMMAAPMRTADAPEAQQRFVSLEPEPGSVFLWESWLRHEVMANGSRRRRVSLSFNYA